MWKKVYNFSPKIWVFSVQNGFFFCHFGNSKQCVFVFTFEESKNVFFFFGILTTHCVLLIHVDEKISQKSCDVSKSSFINNMPAGGSSFKLF